MTRLIHLCLLAFMLYSCNNETKNSADKNKTNTDTTTVINEKNTVKDKDEEIASTNPIIEAINILGSYVGKFGDNKIALLITKSTPDTISGRSIVGGNDRPFTGIVKMVGAKYKITVKEPGDNKYDGVFDFTIDPKQPDVVEGSWKPNAPDLKEKTYTLKRREFKYLKNVGEYPQASTRLLTEDDVDNLTKEELQMMRNEIFARHGYCFQKKAMRQKFENKDWYVPNTTDIKSDLTELEKKNILFIKKYENYVEEYGDVFGR